MQVYCSLLAWGWLSLLWLAGAGCDLLSLLVGLLLGFVGEVLLIVSAAVVLLLMESMSSAGLEGDSFSDTAGFWVSLQMLPLSAIFFYVCLLPYSFDACSREPVPFDSRLIQGVCSLCFSI